MSAEEQQQNSWNVVALQHAIELTQHIKKNWQSDHYSDELVVCARRFYLHIKKTFEENVRTSKEWREFREKLQEEILILLVDNRHGRQGSDFSATNLKKIVNPGGSADSKFAGAICAYICFKISHEIFQEHIIISNRLSSLLMEAHDNYKNRTFQRKDILISELMMLVYSTCMSGMAIWPATSKFDELLFVEDQVKRYHACLFYFHMASKHPIDFYRNHFRSAMRRNGRKTDKIVAKLIRIVCDSVNSEHNEMRVAAFSALKAILNLVASRETALSEGRNWPKDLVNSIIEGLKNTESDRIGPILCCYLLVDISAAKNNYTNSLKTCLKKLRIAQTWNPCAQKNKTEKFFDAVFKYDLVEEALQNPMGGTRFTNLQPNSSTAERLLDENVETLSHLVLSQRSMKNSINIHPYLLPLLPKLCAFNPKKFEPFFVKTIDYCLQEIAPAGNQKTTTRRNQGTALISMGMIIHLICESDSELADPTTRPTTVLEEQIDTKVIPKLKSVLKEAFISFQMSRGGVDCDPTLFQCIELISISLTDLHKKLWFKPQNKEFLNMIVAFGLIEIKDSWIRCVQSLNSKISRDQVSHGMEQVLLKNLFNERLPSQIMNGYSDDHSCLSSLPVLIPFKNGEDFDFGRVSVRKRIASLKALEMFEFTDFSRYKKLIYRWKEYFNPKEKIQVKIAAAKAVTRVLRLFIIHSSTCGPNLVGETTISNIIRKLLQIADTIIPYKQESQSTQLKLAIYRSLKPEFDAYLIHQHNLERIMNAIHQPYPVKEENFTDRLEVQEAVMEIIGRLNAMNAAETMPHIRMMINDLWTQLQMPDQASARLLEVLFRHANQAQLSLFVDPTIRQIEPLLSYEFVQGYPPRMTCTLIDCLSAISAVNGPRLEKDTLNRFFSLIYRLLVETTEPTVKVSALRCLSSLIEHHNYVISPYFKHRKLMDDMLALVTADKKMMQHEINEEALRMIGRLGALDPYQYKEITKKRRSNSQNEKQDGFTSINEMLVNDSRCPDEKFIIRVAVELIKAKLSHGGDVTAPLHSLDNLIQHAGTNILPHLGKVMPELHRIAQDPKAKKEIKSNILGLFEKLLQKMRRRVLPFMDDIKETMETQKDISYAPLRKKLAQLIYQAAYNLQYEFKDYMGWAVRYILQLFEKLKSSTDPQDEEATIYLVRAIGKFGYIEAHYSVLLRPLATMLQSHNSSDQLRGEILVVLEARIVRTAMPDYFMILSEAILVALAYEVGADKHTIIKNHGHHSSSPTKDYDLRETAVNCLRYMRSGMRHFNLWEEEYDDYFQMRTGNLWKPSEDPEMVFQDNAFKNDFSQDQSMIKEGEDEHDTAHYNWLKDEFEVDCQTAEDFKDLQVRISKCFLSHSKSAVIRGLRGMDRLYNVPVNLIIFNCSFYAMWAEPKPVRELQIDGSEATRIPEDPIKPYRDHITKGLLKIIDGKNTDPPRAILSFFLDLAHFLELSDIDKERLDQPGGSLKAFGGLNGIGKLADCAERTDAYAKALHYREMEFLYKTSEKDNKEKERKIAESLIKSFQKLGEQEAAEGVLEFAKSNDITVNAEWFEKLNRWEEAKKRYADGNDNPYDQLGYMRCLEALGEWDELCAKTYEFDEEIEDQKIESVKLGTTAAWHLGNWDEFQRLHSIIPVNTFDGAFYRAVHSVQHSRYEEARKWTMEARKDLETSLTMQDKNYSRVYGTVFNAQLCSELEEVIEHRTANRQRQIAIQEMWESRLCGTSSDDGQRVDGVQLVIEEWQKILLLRSLVKQQNTAAFPRDDTEEHFNIRNG